MFGQPGFVPRGGGGRRGGFRGGGRGDLYIIMYHNITNDLNIKVVVVVVDFKITIKVVEDEALIKVVDVVVTKEVKDQEYQYAHLI